MKSQLIAFTVAGLSFVFTPALRADVEAVNKYLGEATELVDKGSSFFDDARGKLELAESSMDDVPAADKAALQAKIDALKFKIDGAADEQAAKILDGKIKSAMNRLEGSIGNLVTWKGAAAELKEYLDDPKAGTLLGADALAAYRKQFAAFEKLNGTKALKANLEQAKTAVDELEQDWAKTKADMADTNGASSRGDVGVENGNHAVENAERFFTDLPADNADVKALRARVDKVKAEIVTSAGDAGAAGIVEYVDRFLETYRNDFAEMDKESTPPTWDTYKQSRNTGAAASAAFVSRVSGFLKDLNDNEQYQTAKDNPAVKAKVGELTRRVDTARTRVKSYFEILVSGLEKEKINSNNLSTTQLLASEIRNTLGTDTDDGKAMVARVEKLDKEFTEAGNKADADKTAYYAKMSEQAAKAWPDMMAKFDVTEGFDPNNYKDFKGKYIKITTDNLMGYHFKPGDFPFATTLNGKPVAGKYDPAIAAALAEVEGKIGRSVGDSDDDGKWIVIARVEGSTGTLYQKQEVTGALTDTGGSSAGSWSGTQVTPVESPIVTVVALKAGPVAAAAGQGTVKEDGTVGKSAPPPAGSALAAGSTSGGRGFSPIPFVMGLFAIVVGAACLMKAKFAPLATNAGAMQLTDKVGGQNIQYLGLAGILLGAIGVLMNLLALLSAPLAAFIGIVASLAMIVAGGVAARDFFDSKRLLPASVGQMLNQFAIPAGLACAALGLLTMIVAI